MKREEMYAYVTNEKRRNACLCNKWKKREQMYVYVTNKNKREQMYVYVTNKNKR